MTMYATSLIFKHLIIIYVFIKNLTTFMVFEILFFMVLNMYFVIEKNVGINFDSQYFA